ncbi:glutathione S-transferase-like protein [Clohesyomyces aquaticus]|uniref:Glutathione S-transferase-like protein n=1 Tax=Clohesyomyces aquaticus TaxID=1231657 RepID=A0A1Y1ZZJ7_9PLEO|nr:glutathione S-transferase-like protein [Clohesyomyces aquaticus]
MPTTHEVSKPGSNNDKIGGVPTIHYLDFRSRGRGQAIRLMWEDAEMAYEDITSLHPTANIPVVELNGKILTQSYSILRHFAQQLETYGGTKEEEKYWVDGVCDIAIDTFFSNDKENTYREHSQTTCPRFPKALETHLNSNTQSQNGPYVIGDIFTYVDMVLHQICHDEDLVQRGRKGLAAYPRLKALVDGMESRPNIKKFLQSQRYLG